MSEGKIIEIYNQGISQVIETIKLLSNQIKEQSTKIEQLTKENKALSTRVQSLENQTNTNSSKPPSSDGFKKKTKSLRTLLVKNLAVSLVTKVILLNK